MSGGPPHGFRIALERHVVEERHVAEGVGADLPGVHEDDGAQIGQIRGDEPHEVEVRLVRRDDDGAGVLQDVLDLGAVELRVERHHAHPRAAARKVGLHPLGTVRQHERDVLGARTQREMRTIRLGDRAHAGEEVRPAARMPVLGLKVAKRRGLRRLLGKLLKI